ncbi:MAG: DNA polymerase I [Anaerovoracaceae bacterium]|jgi:DNA polymerase-1
MSETAAVIDGNSLLNRAYYAIRTPMITSKGIYTQGVFAFINMLRKIESDYNPDYIAVAFDRSAPTFRHKKYKDYKAGRKPTPPELLMEFPILKEILEAANIKVLEIDGYEADDILGTVSKKGEELGVRTYLVSGDRDIFQLASDMTSVVYTKRGVSEFGLYDRDAIIEEYGFPPEQFIDYKALMGDKSDNIPGIPGIGDKTARKLITEYGTVENVIESAGSMKKSKMRDNIENNAMQAMTSKRLVTIFRDVPLDYTFDDLKTEEPDYDKIAEIYKDLEFHSFLKRLVKEGKITGSQSGGEQTEKAADDENHYDRLPGTVTAAPEDVIHVEDMDGLEKMFGSIGEGEYVWLQVFHNDAHIEKPEIYSVCLAAENGFFIVHWSDDFAGAFADFFREKKPFICGHDLKPGYYALMANGAADAAGSSYIFNTYFDTAIAEYLLDPAKRSYDLSELMPDYFQESFPDRKEIKEQLATQDMFGGTFDSQADLGLKILSASSRIAPVQAAKLSEEELTFVFDDIEMPLVEVLASMEVSGISTDRSVLENIGASLSAETEQLTEKIYEYAGEEFNINSPKQLGTILFEKLGLKNGKKTKTGYSTSAEVLEKIADQHPIVPLILEYRMVTKLNGTYVEGMLPLIDADGKIHAHFQQTVAATGRLSCTEPNLQNIPVRTELGRQFRKAFVAGGVKDGEDDGSRVLVGADYSQVELRVMAHLSGDEAMINSFKENQDIHTMTASRVFGVPADEVTPIMRSRAKAVNFGVIYGISAYGLSKDIGISVSEAQNYIDSYFVQHPGVRRYMDECVAFCKAHGYVKTISGRRRWIKEINAKNYMTRQFGERLAMNSPVQGSAADIIKLAMIRTYRALNEKAPGSKLVLQVHDELIIDAETGSEDEIKKLLEESMSGAVSLKIPLAADVNSGSSWFELK